MDMSDRPLTPQRRRFLLELVKDPAHNAKQAAIRAGYAEGSAEVQASQLLSIPKVRAEYDRLLAEQEEALGFDGIKVLKELAGIAFVELEGPTKDEDGNFNWPAIRASDKTKALELLGKHFKLFTEKVEHSGKVTLEQLLEQAEGE